MRRYDWNIVLKSESERLLYFKGLNLKTNITGHWLKQPEQIHNIRNKSRWTVLRTIQLMFKANKDMVLITKQLRIIYHKTAVIDQGQGDRSSFCGASSRDSLPSKGIRREKYSF